MGTGGDTSSPSDSHGLRRRLFELEGSHGVRGELEPEGVSGDDFLLADRVEVFDGSDAFLEEFFDGDFGGLEVIELDFDGNGLVIASVEDDDVEFFAVFRFGCIAADAGVGGKMAGGARGDFEVAEFQFAGEFSVHVLKADQECQPFGVAEHLERL